MSARTPAGLVVAREQCRYQTMQQAVEQTSAKRLDRRKYRKYRKFPLDCTPRGQCTRPTKKPLAEIAEIPRRTARRRSVPGRDGYPANAFFTAADALAKSIWPAYLALTAAITPPMSLTA